MMADSQFQGKSDHIGEKGSRRIPIKNSLGMRILLVCIFVMLLPTFIYSLRVTFRVFQLKVREVGQELILIGSNYEKEMQRFILLQEQNLSTWNMFPVFEELTREEKPCLSYCAFFEKIAKKQNLSSLYFIKRGAEGKLLYFVSSQPGRIGQEVFFAHELEQVGKSREIAAFLAEDPATKEREVFFVYVVNTQEGVHLGYLVSGVPAERLLNLHSYEKAIPYPFDISIVNPDGTLFLSSNPAIPFSNLKIISMDTIEEEITARFSFFQTEGNISRSILFRKETWFGLKIPIEGTDFSFLIDIPNYRLFSVDARDSFLQLFFVFVCVFVFGMPLAVWMTHRMARPLLALSKLMEKVGQGALNERYQKDRMGFEINLLGENFNQMTLSLVDYIQKANAEKIAKETFANELKIGYEIQKTILPRAMPKVPGLDLAAGFVPAKEVGGDFYDLLLKEDKKKLAFAIADASGKGISACLYSLCLRSMLRSFDVLYDNISDVIRLANQLFCIDTSDTGMFVTAWVGMYDTETNILHYSCCGHLPALLCRKDGEVIELVTEGTALGVVPFDKVIAAQVKAFPGDYIVLYTDGIIEAHDMDGKLFGKKRLIEVLRQAKEQTSQQVVDKVLHEVEVYSQGRPQHDDVTILVVRVI